MKKDNYHKQGLKTAPKSPTGHLFYMGPGKAASMCLPIIGACGFIARWTQHVGKIASCRRRRRRGNLEDEVRVHEAAALQTCRAFASAASKTQAKKPLKSASYQDRLGPLTVQKWGRYIYIHAYI